MTSIARPAFNLLRRSTMGWPRSVRTPFAALVCAALTGGMLGHVEPPPMPPASPVERIIEVPAPPVVVQLPTAAEREQSAVSAMLAKRYRVAHAAVAGFVVAAYRAGLKHKVDPLLLLAVISVESRFNPLAEGAFGATGLMQIIPKFHMEKLKVFGGKEALRDPEVNILVGAQILREYMRRFGGIEDALQAYSGAFGAPTSEYAAKVLSEKTRLEQFVARRGRPA